ncbi:helix-turn-helix domain-containing protein [Bacillus cihuensis]|uniref:helix-turn-helix domain-containing protein n=1 Tax=Bacillus cihuensis TaxID=1208599 RepID=UPI0003F732D8|nr:helix-turn-helix domain-containing protein [Bacillus cihuensis]
MDWYTQQEVADMLGISKATVYHWGKQKKIIKIPDPYRTIRETRYQRAEVDAIARELKTQPKGLPPSKVAKKLGVSVQKIYKLIQEGTIKASEVPVGDERKTYVISAVELEQAEKLLTPSRDDRPTRSEFYDSRNGVALFQKFYSSKISEARITRNEQNDWGFLIQSNQKWIPYEEGVKVYQLVPSYPIHADPVEFKGYVTFEIPSDIIWFYSFMDYLYQVWGMENIRLRVLQDGSIKLLVRAGEKRLTSNQAFSISDILPFLMDGEIIKDDELFILRSSYRKTTVELPKKMLKQVIDAAEKEGISMSLWLEHLIEKNINKED